MNRFAVRKIVALMVLAIVAVMGASSVLAQPSHIVGLVFIDANGNGQYDAGEHGYPGHYWGATENGEYVWRYRGTNVMLRSASGGDIITVQSAGYKMGSSADAACSAQGESRPCEGTFGFVSSDASTTWQISIDVPAGYMLTTPAVQTAQSGIVDIGIQPMLNVPRDMADVVFDVADGPSTMTVDGASARMMRTPEKMGMVFDTTDLPVGHVVSLWAHAFNYPMYCDQPCNANDVFISGPPGPRYTNPDGSAGRPGVDYSLMGFHGVVVPDSGNYTFTGEIAINTAPGAPFGNGLHNPLGAEVHWVLRDHGPASTDPAKLAIQIENGNGGCKNFDGGGDYMCVDFQLGIFGR